MDQVFAQLALTSISLVSRAAFSAITSAAVKEASSFVKSRINGGSKEFMRFEKKKMEFEIKMEIICSLLDKIESNENICRLLDEVKDDIKRILRHPANNDESRDLVDSGNTNSTTLVVTTTSNVSCSNSDTPTTPTRTTTSGTLALHSDRVSELINDISDLIQKVDSLIPYLQLQYVISSNSTSKTNTPSNEGFRLYPAKILKASYILSHKTPISCTIRLLNLFSSSLRESGDNLTWKEVYPVGKLNFKPSGDYIIRITQSKDDGRFHDDSDGEDELSFSISSVDKLFLVSSGQLLKIEDSDSSALVLKVMQKGSIEYYAIELVDETNEFDSDSESTCSTESIHDPTFPPTPKKESKSKFLSSKISSKDSVKDLNTLQWILKLAFIDYETKGDKTHLDLCDTELRTKLNIFQ